MADSETNWIDFFISLTPVVQTSIWAGVSVYAVFILRKPLQRLGDELIRRVNQGDTLTTPWLSLERRAERERQVVEQVTKNVRSELIATGTQNTSPLSHSDNAIIEDILEKVGARFIYLDFSASRFKIKNGKDITTSLYVTDWKTVSDFLNETYNVAIENGVEIPIWKYGIYWHFKNNRTGEYIEKNGKGRTLDSRPFLQLSIEPGDLLIAERI